jgi:hypothetical protein
MQTSKSSDSSIRYTALSLGLLFLLLDLAGFVPGFVTPSGNFTSQPGFGYIFGVFPTNYFHNAIALLVGVWGIAMPSSSSAQPSV